MMLRLILLFILIVTSSLINSSNSQVLWQSCFETPNKGIWVDSLGNSIVDTTQVNWSVDFEQCTFSDEGDYAKTVHTSGGRFEVLDSDGTVYWKSPLLDISAFEMVGIQLKAAETGSASNEDKKFIIPQIIVDGKLNPFSSDSIASGNWGEKTFQETGISGNNLQIVVMMNSSYSADKVYIDEVIVEAIDPKNLEPNNLKIIVSENVTFLEDTIIVNASIFNAYKQSLNNATLQLSIKSKQLRAINSSFVEGVYQWKLLPLMPGTASYTIEPLNFKIPSKSKSIYVINENDQLTNKQYEDSTIVLNSDWEISTENAIKGKYSVKHLSKEVKGTSDLQLFNDTLQLAQGHFQFKFKVRNGDWNPSSSNNFNIRFLQNYNGYAFGVNSTGSSDLFSMWKIENNEASELLLETNFRWMENSTAEVEIFRTARGKWQVFLRDPNKQIIGNDSVFDNSILQLDRLQLNYEYTKTRAGLLWFDDLKIAKVDIPPTITKVESIDFGKLIVHFNEAVDTSNFQRSQIKIWSEEASCKITNSKFDSQEVLIIDFEANNSLNYQLQIKAITDLKGNFSEALDFHFTHAIQPRLHELIITEIMADPSPSAGLPATEYLEIYNASDAHLSLKETRISINEKTQELPERTLPPKSYWVLCEDRDTLLFDLIDPIISLATLPTLLNTGTSVVLRLQNQIIDSVFYKQAWYGDSEKEKGGYSLEKIDLIRFCGNKANWMASEHPLGGTPGAENSVQASNIDLHAPQITDIKLISARSISIHFSEAIDTITVPKISFSPSATINAIELQDSNKSIKIEFQAQFLEDVRYEINIENIADECGNIASTLNGEFIWHHIEKGDIYISEILFNPNGNGSDFFELYSAVDYSFDCSKLRVATRDDSLKFKSISNLSSKTSPFISNTFSVFTKDTLNLIENYSLPVNASYHQLDKMPAFNNDHGIIVLLNDSLEVVDELEYDENMHSQFLYDNEGISLERISFNRPTNQVENWYSGDFTNDYVSPCFVNTQVDLHSEAVSIEMQSDVVSPNFDNYHDELILTFHLDQTEYLTNIFVFNMNGKLLAHPVNNELISNNTMVTYDCKTTKRQTLKSAPYFIMIEMISSNGRKHQLREAFYVANTN